MEGCEQDPRISDIRDADIAELIESDTRSDKKHNKSTETTVAEKERGLQRLGYRAVICSKLESLVKL